MARMLRVAVVLIFLFLLGVTSAGGQEPGLPPSAAAEEPPVAADEPSSIQAPASVLQVVPDPLVTERHNSFAYGGGLLYWEADCAYQADPSPVYIRRQPETGGATQTLYEVTSPTVAQCGSVSPYNLADDDGFFYFNPAENRLDARLSHEPGTVIALINDLDMPQPVLATDDDYVYVNRPLGIYRSAKDSLGTTKLNNATGVKGLVVDETYIYWLDATGLWRASKTCISPSCWGSKEQVSSVGGDKHLNWTEEGDLLWVAQRLGGWSVMEYNASMDHTSSIYWSSYDSTANIGRPVYHDGCFFWLEDRDPGILLNDFLRRKCGSTVESIDVGRIVARDQLAVGPLGLVFSDEEDDAIYRVDFDAEAMTRDFYLNAMEVTQGIQNLYQEVDLVAQKTTYVRVFGGLWTNRGADAVQVRLRGWRDGTELADSPLYPVGHSRSLGPAADWDRANADDAWLFQLPQSWIQEGTLTLEAEVDPHDVYGDPNPADNTLVAYPTFQRKAPICYVFVSVSTEAGIGSKEHPTIGPMVDLAKRLLPVHDLRVHHQHGLVEELEVCWGWGFIPYACHGPYELWQDSLWGDWADDGSKVITDLAARYSVSDLDCDSGRVQFVGLVHEDSTTAECTGCPITTGMGRDDSHASWVLLADTGEYDRIKSDTGYMWTWPRSGATMVHESGHNIERDHIDCGGPATPHDDEYPYTDANGDPCILDDGDLESYDTHYGFDIDSLTPIQPHIAGLSDLMTYASYLWASDYTWEAFFDELPVGPAPDAATGSQPASLAAPERVDVTTGDSVVLIGGLVSPTAGEGRLNYAWVYPTDSVSSQVLGKLQALAAPAGEIALEALAGDGSRAVPVDQYLLRLRDANDDVIADYPFVPDIMVDNPSPDEVAGFLLSFPAPTVPVAEITLLSYSTVLDRLEPGPSTPTVEILQPAGGETIVDGMTIVWQATDADADDELLFTVQYSPDLGQTWRTVVNDWPGLFGSDTMTLTLDDLLGIPGSTTGGLVRVLASDGYNTAMATSEPFVVENQPPQPYILSPAPDQYFEAGDPILLRGDASDEEDGSVDDASLSWEVTDQATVTGKEVFLAGLAPGDYDVVLTAEDSEGATGTAESALTISPLAVPSRVATPELDGFCDDDVYQSGVLVGLKPYPDGSQATARLLRTGDHLWACFSGLKRGSAPSGDRPANSAGLLIDPDHSHEHALQAGDLWVYVQEDGTPTVWAGPTWGGDATPDGLQARVSANANAWMAELRLDASLLGNWNHLVGLELMHVWAPETGGSHYGWPYAANTIYPDSWATTVLGKWPQIDSLNPGEAFESTGSTIIAVSGHDLDSDAVALWNGAPRPTYVVDSTALLMTIEAGDLVADGTAEVRVQNPGLGGAPSNALTFTIKNPVPEITEIVPEELTAGTDGFLIRVAGEGFDWDAVALWNGEPKATSVSNPTSLGFMATAADLATVRDVGIVVQNPDPGGGVSNVISFTLLPPPNLPPDAPFAPDPADDATDVPTDQDLAWQGSDPEGQPLRYDVAFGTGTPPTVVTGLADASYDPGPLEPDTTYNWQITACDGLECTVGDTWSFTTAAEPVDNQPPYVPSRPDPSDGLTGVPVDQMLSWRGGDPDGDEVHYSVALGPDSPPPTVVRDTPETTYMPPDPLEAGQIYFWRITAFDGEYTSVGPIWSFTTLPDNRAPYVPSRPSPPDGERDVELDPVLSWVGGDPDGDRVTYTVYLGSGLTLPRVWSGVDLTSFEPGPLEPDTRYRWYVTAWDGELTTTGPTWSFATVLPNLPPYPPYKPDPADRETGVPVDQVLSWLASDPERDRLTYDIYFGPLNPPLIADKGLIDPSYDPGPLDPDTPYYWSVTVKDAEHSTVGPTWSFKTAPANTPPSEPYAPYPADRETDVPLNQLLAWRCYDPDRNALTYDVYFGTTNPPILAKRGLDTAMWRPGTLSPDTSYYWAILASDGTDTTLGPTWRFHTLDISYVYLPLILRE